MLKMLKMLKMVTEENYCFYYVRTIYKDSIASPSGQNLKADYAVKERKFENMLAQVRHFCRILGRIWL